MPWPLGKKQPTSSLKSYSQYNSSYQPYQTPQVGGQYDTRVGGGAPAPRPGPGGGGSGGQYPHGTVTTGAPMPPKPTEPQDPKSKMRAVVKQLKQVIVEQKSRVKELGRDARRSLNAGDKDSYDLYVDSMVQVRMFMKKLNRAITSVNLIGTNMDMNQCNAQITGALVDFIKIQGENTKYDMDEVTREYFNNQTNLEDGLQAFLENMRDLNDPDGTMEEERQRERAKIEEEFGRVAVTGGPNAVEPQQNKAVQEARDRLMNPN